MSKYKDIKNIYNLIDINDSCIVSNVGKNKFHTFVYEVKDAVFLQISDDIKNKVFRIYKEFLKEINFDFKIVIKNERIDIDKYIDNIDSKTSIEVKNSSLYYEFITDLRKKLQKENLYERRCFIILSFCDEFKTDVDNVENLIQKLREIGCDVDKVYGKEEIEKIVFEFVNKGVNYEF